MNIVPTKDELLVLGGGGTYINIAKFAFNNEIDNLQEADVWSHGGVLDHLAVAEFINVVSDDLADEVDIVLTGVGADYKLLTESVKLTGSVVPAQTVNKFLRVWRASVDSSSTLTNTGTVTGTASDSASVQFSIEAGIGQAEMSHFTVPAGYNALLKYANFGASFADEATIRVFTSRNGGAFLVASTTHVSATATPLDFSSQPIVFPEKTDIVARAKSFDNNTKVSMNYLLMLVPISEFE